MTVTIETPIMHPTAPGIGTPRATISQIKGHADEGMRVGGTIRIHDTDFQFHPATMADGTAVNLIWRKGTTRSERSIERYDFASALNAPDIDNTRLARHVSEVINAANRAAVVMYMAVMDAAAERIAADINA